MNQEDFNLYQVATTLYAQSHQVIKISREYLGSINNKDISATTLAKKKELNDIISNEEKREETYKKIKDDIEQKYFGTKVND